MWLGVFRSKHVQERQNGIRSELSNRILSLQTLRLRSSINQIWQPGTQAPSLINWLARPERVEGQASQQDCQQDKRTGTPEFSHTHQNLAQSCPRSINHQDPEEALPIGPGIIGDSDAD